MFLSLNFIRVKKKNYSETIKKKLHYIKHLKIEQKTLYNQKTNEHRIDYKTTSLN